MTSNGSDMGQNASVFVKQKKYNKSAKLVLPSKQMLQFMTHCESVFRNNFINVMHCTKQWLKLVNCAKKSTLCMEIQCQNVLCFTS